MSEPYMPTTEEVREAISEWAWSRRMFRPEFGQSDGREADRWLSEHDRQVAERAYRAAEDAAAEALTTWWLTDASPDEDTSSVMDVRNAIRGLYRAAKGEQK